MASLITPLGTMTFPTLFTPRAVVAGGEPRYSLNLIIDPINQKTPAFQAMRRAVAQAIDEKWGAGKSQDKAFVAKLKNPFLPTTDQAYEGYEDPNAVFIRPWSKNRPGVVDAYRNEITVPADVWSGQLVRCSVNPFAYEMSGNRGVSFGLNNVQVCRVDGKRLDGRRAAKDEFSEYQDPSQPVMDDETIPF